MPELVASKIRVHKVHGLPSDRNRVWTKRPHRTGTTTRTGHEDPNCHKLVHCEVKARSFETARLLRLDACGHCTTPEFRARLAVSP